MSADAEGLYQEILRHPSDDTPRLIYADWLDENDQPLRAEFIRTQVHLAQSEDCGHFPTVEGCVRCAMLMRQTQLLGLRGLHWLAELPGVGWTWRTGATWLSESRQEECAPRLACFSRGFIAYVTLATDTFYDVAAQLFEQHPIERVRLNDRWPVARDGGFWWVNSYPEQRESLPLFIYSLQGDRDLDVSRFSTEAAALDALSDACVRFGKIFRSPSGRQKVYTTGQVSKICQVSNRTVTKWFDSGRLSGYRIPGNQDRRIPRERLLRFLIENRIPLNGLTGENLK